MKINKAVVEHTTPPHSGQKFIRDDELRGFALRITAHGAGIGGVEIAADAARMDPRRRLRERRPQGLQQSLAALQEIERRAPRRARPETGQLREVLDKALDFGHGKALSYQPSAFS